MKKQYFLIIFTAIISLSTISCNEDFLDVKPSIADNSSEGFDDPIKIEAFLTGIYDRLQWSDFTLSILLHADVKGEDIYVVSSGNYGWFVTSYQYSEDPYSGNQYDYWLAGYKIIANCNQLISKLPSSTIDQSLKNHYLAEARALRAYTYFQLVRLFAQPYSVNPDAPGVPITLAPIAAEENFPGRSTVGQVYAEIVKDLQFAETNFDESHGNTVYRLTLPSIRGLQARVYLNMENWQLARDYAVDARTDFPLMSAEELNGGFADVNSEWMWAINMREDDNEGYLMIPSFYDLRTTGYNSFRADVDFYALFEDNDARKLQFTYDGVNDYFSKDGYAIFKFEHRDSWNMDQVLMRASEMYLIEAEAEAELNHEPEARTALNEIKNRAGITPASDLLTGQALKDTIQLERRKELFGEGFRLFDLTRRKQPLVRSSTSQWVPLDLPANDPHMVLPIPQEEIDANPNISEADQNEAYR